MLVVGGVIAAKVGDTTSSNTTQTKSYKDGVAVADQVSGNSTSNPDGDSNAVSSAIVNGCVPTANPARGDPFSKTTAPGTCEFASGDGSGKEYSNAFCGVYVDQMLSGDNRSEWMAGCIAEYEHDVYDYMHSGAGG